MAGIIYPSLVGIGRGDPPPGSYGPGIWMTVIELFHSPCIESCFKKWVGLVGWNFWVVRLERLVMLCYVC